MRYLLRFVSIALLLAMMVLPGFNGSVALADSPHFVRASASLVGSQLFVSFKEAGLGDNVSIDYEASANATATYACINGGGKHPQAANKETVSGPVSATGTFTSGKNGSISATLILNPPSPGSFTCPPGQDLVLAAVSCSNVQIKDVTNNITESIAGFFSRIFFNV